MSSTVKFSTIGDLLKGSPYDPSFAHGGTLTESIFYDDFYVEPPSMKSFSSDLRSKLDNPFLTHVVTFVSGYAGNGKTTFLKAFIRAHRDDYEHVYYAATEWQKPDAAPTSRRAPDRVMAMIRRNLCESDGIAETLDFIHANRKVLVREDFISRAFCRFLDERPEGEAHDADFVDLCAAALDLGDTFAVLFIHLFRRAVPGRKTIVYFDNLDIAPIEYLVTEFWEHFHYALTTAERLATDKLFEGRVDCRSDFRFVFCLRDTNEAILNAHVAGRLDVARLSFPLPFDSDFYSKIVDRRLDYLDRHFPGQSLVPAGKFSALVRAVLEDEYFHHVFMRLYNCDYRAVVTGIVEVLKDLPPPPRIEITYGMRGIIVFGLVRQLLKDNFLKDYLDHAKRKDGWCYIDRVMLTVLMNRSGYYRGRNEIDRSHAYGLFNLIQDLRPLYDVRSIVNSIVRCYLNHRHGWVHLVTVLNTNIDDTDVYVTSTRLAQLFEEAARDPGNTAARNDLNRIAVRVNPAGFTFVRYILNHFEFYANLPPVNNKAALFTDPLGDRVIDGLVVYDFEKKIDAVLAQVTEHVEMMRKFFDTHYASVRVTGEDFALSPYCFRHQGMARVAEVVGQSHTISLVTSHIDYIDHFRHQIVGRRSPLPEEEAERVNGLLCDRLERYVYLLAKAPDATAATRLADKFVDDIDQIRKNRFLKT